VEDIGDHKAFLSRAPDVADDGGWPPRTRDEPVTAGGEPELSNVAAAARNAGAERQSCA
jgi:hypothetical protein